MNTPEKNRAFSWPLIAGVCGLLALWGCGLASILGMGGFLWFSRSATSQPQKIQRAPAGEPQVVQSAPASFNFDDAVLADLQGWVEVQEEDGAWGPAAEGQQVSVGGRVRTGELSSVKLEFSDGSQASLEANSEISIDELEILAKGEERRILLTQWTGESDHEVAPNAAEDSRYEVRTPSGTGEAKGTVFHVAVTPEGTAQYSVVEGTVAVTSLEVTVLVNAGEITIIYFDQPPLEPVLYVSGQGVVTQTGDTWVIANQEFSVTSDTTIIGDPQVGDWAFVEGRLLEDDTQVADRIIALHTSPVNHFSLSGTAEAIGDSEWTVNGQAVAITTTTEIEAGIVTGDLVLVEGLVLDGGLLQAESIERLDAELGLPFDFTGVVQEIGAESWLISEIHVTVNEETIFGEDLEAGDLVRVRGWIQEDGAWLAGSISQVEDQTRRFEFSGVLESMDPWQAAGITFETREWTVIEAGLELGDLVRVVGEIDAEGTWVAAEIERVEDVEAQRMVLIGTVFSIDPWVVSGIPLAVSDETVILGEITEGALVRVEIVLLADGTWQIISIELLETQAWFPGCMDIVAVVVSVDGNQIQLENWPLLTLNEDVQVEGEITANSVIRFRVCFDEDMQITIIYIIIIDHIDVEETGDLGGKVMVCHKPGKKKGGHAITIARPALPAHLGHGDYVGPCR